MIPRHSLTQRHEQSCGLCCTKINNLGVTLGKTEILRDVNIHIHCGELTVLIGPNGAGKSTLLKAVLGEIPHTGELSFVDARGSDAKRPLIGYVPQRLEFDSGSPISVLDLFTVSLTGKPAWLIKPGSLQRRVTENLTRVQAAHLINRRLGDLSGGELQRVLLALALDPVPDLLLLDEPVSGIDRQGMELFYNLVSEIRHQFDLSIILVSHDLALVSEYADRVIFLNKTVIYSGKPAGLLLDNSLAQTLGSAWLKGLYGSQLSGMENRGGLE